MWINPELNASDAFAVIWQPGTEGEGVADVIVTNAKNKTNFDFKGKLSFSWPATSDQTPLNKGQENYNPLFPYGFGLTYVDDDTLSDNLSESAQENKKSSSALEIFNNRSIDPWSLVLQDDVNNVKPVTTSVAALGAVSYRAVDRAVQEDSLQLQWSGKAKASAGFFAKERVDYSALPEKSALVFDVKIDRKPTADVKLSMACGSDCGGEKSIAEDLKKLDVGQWSTVSVPLECFSKAKLDMLLSPFNLSTDGELNVVINHVRIESTSKPSVSCL